MTKRVLIIQELLAQYRVDFYERLRPLLADKNIELSLIHGRAVGDRALRRDEAVIPWATRVSALHPFGQRGAAAIWQPVLRHALHADLVVAEHANRQLVNYPLVSLYRAGIGPNFAFWGHGANLQAATENSRRERFKRLTAGLPHWWFAYTESSAQRVASAGFPSNRITVVQNSVSVEFYGDAIPARKRSQGCVYVGGLDEHKRITFLLQAASYLNDMLSNFTLTIIGDGKDRALVESWARAHQWLNYVGPKVGVEKAHLVSEAQLLLMPGLVGLAIIDSFAAETPIVTVDLPFHSPEIEYLRPGFNGVLCSSGITPAGYAHAVANLLGNKRQLNELRRGCRESRAQYSLNEMVTRFGHGVEQALLADRR